MSGRSVAVGALISLTVGAVIFVGWGSDDYQAVLPVMTRTEPVCGLLATNAADSLRRSGRPGLSAIAEPGDPVQTATVATSLQRQREVLRHHRAGFLRPGAGFTLTRALFATESALCDLALNPRGNPDAFGSEVERLRSEYRSDLAKAELELPHSAFETKEGRALAELVFGPLDGQEKMNERAQAETERLEQIRRMSAPSASAPPAASAFGQVARLPPAGTPRRDTSAAPGSPQEQAYMPSEEERLKALALVQRLGMNPALPRREATGANRPDLNLPDTSQVPDYGREGHGYQRTPSNTGTAPIPNAKPADPPNYQPPPG